MTHPINYWPKTWPHLDAKEAERNSPDFMRPVKHQIFYYQERTHIRVN